MKGFRQRTKLFLYAITIYVINQLESLVSRVYCLPVLHKRRENLCALQLPFKSIFGDWLEAIDIRRAMSLACAPDDKTFQLEARNRIFGFNTKSFKTTLAASSLQFNRLMAFG